MSESTSILFPSRVPRLPFLGRYVLLTVAAVIAGVLLDLGGSASSLSSTMRLSLSAASCILLVLILVCLFRSILFPRLRDIGLHTAYSLLIFVPFLNLLFLIALLVVPKDTFTKPSGNASQIGAPKD